MPALFLRFPEFDPVLVHIGPFAIRWYALAYIAGILLGWLYARRIIANDRYWGGPAPFTVPDYDGFVLFYNYALFVANPSEIVQVWKGGMSFHGGFLGCVLAVVLFAWKRGIPF